MLNSVLICHLSLTAETKKCGQKIHLVAFLAYFFQKKLKMDDVCGHVTVLC